MVISSDIYYINSYSHEFLDLSHNTNKTLLGISVCSDLKFLVFQCIGLIMCLYVSLHLPCPSGSVQCLAPTWQVTMEIGNSGIVAMEMEGLQAVLCMQFMCDYNYDKFIKWHTGLHN